MLADSRPRRTAMVQGIVAARRRAGELRRQADVVQRADGSYWHPRGEDIARNESMAAAYTTLYHREMGWA